MSNSVIPEIPKLDVYLGSFNDATLERQFREYKLDNHKRDSAITMIVPVMVILLFAISDFFHFGLSTTFSSVMIFRVVYAVCTLACAWAVWNMRDIFSFDVILVGWALMTDVFSISISLSRPPDYYHYLLMDILVLVFVYTILPFKLAYKVPTVLAMTVVEFWAVYTYKDPWPEGVAFASYAAFGTVNVLGYLVSRRVNINDRTEFLRLRSEQKLTEKWEQTAAQQTELVSRLKEADALNSRLFSIIGRDLHTVFQTLLSLSGHDLDGSNRPNPGTEARNAETLAGSRELLENLIAWARLQTGDMNYKPQVFNFSELMNDILDERSTEFQQKNLVLEKHFPDSLPVVADRPMMELVCRNIVSNAVKFSPEGRPLTVSVSRDGFHLQVQVIDRGEGVSAELQNAIQTGLFAGGFDRDNQSGASGLGLLLCKELVARHKGLFSLTNHAAGGTKAEIIIPQG